MEQRRFLPPGPPGRPRLSRGDIAARLAAGFDPAGRSDAMLERLLGEDQPPGRAALVEGPPTPAAVLVPLVEHADGFTVLLTQRTAHLVHHPGQISFPGGRLEEEDGGDAVVAALRETDEEIGLPAGQVSVLGRLDDYVTGTGFIIAPVVGVVVPPLALRPDPFEVAEIFEVPLDFLLDPENHKLHRRVVAGRHRPFWSMTWDERMIWGATAGILVNLSDVLGRPCG